VTNPPPTDPSIPSESVDYDRIDPRVLVVGAGAAGARTAIELVDKMQAAPDADHELDYHQLE
jgi:succinate dehydrogenase / fumarate reductase flavoprotein subunit